MKVQVDEIPPEGRTFDLEVEGSLLFSDEPGLRFQGPVRSRVTLHRVAGSVAVSGTTRTGLFLQCSRCLEDFAFQVRGEFSLEYRPLSDVQEKGEVQLSADEMDVEYYREGMIDLEEVLMGQVAEAIPFQPLCRDTCRGLCSECGANLNRGDCNCRREVVDPRLAKLKDLFEEQSD